MKKSNWIYLLALLVGTAGSCAPSDDGEVVIREVVPERKGLSLTFIATLDSDKQTHVDWSWDMCQEDYGLDDHRTGETVSFTYPKPGTYVVRVTGTTENGRRVRGLLSFDLFPGLHDLVATVFCDSVVFTFSDSGWPPHGLITIDFGDGSPEMVGFPPFEHVYPDSIAIYSVNVYLGTSEKRKLIDSKDIAIGMSPIASFRFGRVGTEVEFENQSSGSSNSFAWYSNKLLFSRERSPVELFAPIDSFYKIKLQAFGGKCTTKHDTVITLEIPEPSHVFASPYSKTNLFGCLNTIAVPKYLDGDSLVLCDDSPLFGFPHQEHIDQMSSSPLFQWKQYDDPKHVMVVVSKSRIIVHNGEIANPNDLFWAWNDGMDGNMDGNMKTVRYNEGHKMENGEIQYAEDPTPLVPGQVYYWCVYGWNADLSRIAFSSKEFPFRVRN